MVCAVALFGLVLFLALYLAPWNSTRELELGSLESRPIPLSTTWYQGVTVTALTALPITSYKMASYPPLSDTRITKNETQPESIPYDKWAYEAYYLLQGSTVVLSYSFSQSVGFYVIIGAGNFDSWQDGKNTQYYYAYGANINNYVFNMPNPGDDVYFVWENMNFNTASGTAQFLIEYVTFNLTDADSVCNTTVCYFDYDKGSNQVVIVSAGLGFTQNDQANVNYTAGGRNGFYWAILGGVLAATFVIAFALIIVAVIVRRRTYSAI